MTCAFLKGTKNGCVTFECPDTAPGKRYYVTASVKGEGALPCMSFRTAENRWINPRNLLTAEIGGPDVWRKIRAIVTAPDGAKSFTVTLDANNLGPNEIVRYDNLCGYELPGEILK